MTTRVDVEEAGWGARSALAREAATALARLVGMAFVMSVVVGLLLTAAAVALPAPLAARVPSPAAVVEPRAAQDACFWTGRDPGQGRLCEAAPARLLRPAAARRPQARVSS
jgi:hypothetical protein